MANNADRDWTDRVTIAITAESIIAGFMIAYGAVNGQLLVSWGFGLGCKSSEVCNTSGLMGTYIAGMVINAVVLTSFASILLLLNSIPTSNPNRAVCRGRYFLGYDLFLIVILGTGAFVVSNVISIHNFTVTLNGMSIPIPRLADLLYKEFWLYGGFLTVLLVIALVLNSTNLLGFFRGDRWHRHALLCFLCVAAVVVLVINLSSCLLAF